MVVEFLVDPGIFLLIPMLAASRGCSGGALYWGSPVYSHWSRETLGQKCSSVRVRLPVLVPEVDLGDVCTHAKLLDSKRHSQIAICKPDLCSPDYGAIKPENRTRVITDNTFSITESGQVRFAVVPGRRVILVSSIKLLQNSNGYSLPFQSLCDCTGNLCIRS